MASGPEGPRTGPREALLSSSGPSPGPSPAPVLWMLDRWSVALPSPPQPLLCPPWGEFPMQLGEQPGLFPSDKAG